MSAAGGERNTDGSECDHTLSHMEITAMKYILPLAAALSLPLLLMLPSKVEAQLAPVYLDCTIASNHCDVTVDSAGSPEPFRYRWTFNTDGTDATFKYDCTNRSHCSFWCPRYEGPIFAQVEVRDANQQLIGTSSSWGYCTQQDIVLGW
jgi:hypothetical protein